VVYPAGKQLSVVAQAFFDYMIAEGRTIIEENLDRHAPPYHPPVLEAYTSIPA
jgi:hypothetical protein